MQTLSLEGGFLDPPRDAAFAFRSVMTAMAHPGTLHRIEGAQPPAPLSAAAGALLLTLADPDTPVHLAGSTDTQALRDWIRFHTGAPLTGPHEAVFAVGTWACLTPVDAYSSGTPEYPDRSATLIVECTRLEASGTRLSGPGIRDTAALNLPDPAAFAANHARFPLGLDFCFTCGDHLAALPRSTRIG